LVKAQLAPQIDPINTVATKHMVPKIKQSRRKKTTEENKAAIAAIPRNLTSLGLLSRSDSNDI